MKTVGGAEVQLHTFLTSALEEGEWSTSQLGPYTFGKAPPVSHEYETAWGPDPVWRVLESGNCY